LQHGSLPLHGDIARVARYLMFASGHERQALATHLSERATTLCNALGRSMAFSEAAQAMARGFSQALNIDLVPDEPSANEAAVARRIRDRKVSELTEAIQTS